jgi:hypothetical protein
MSFHSIVVLGSNIWKREAQLKTKNQELRTLSFLKTNITEKLTFYHRLLNMP